MVLTINPNEYDVFIGIDVDRKSYATTYSTNNHQGRSLKMPAQPEYISRYFQRRFPDKRIVYAYEAGPTGYGLYDYLAAHNQRCIIVHPPAIQKAPTDRVKTNRIDSRKLSEQLKAGQLEGIRVPTEPYRQLRHLVNLRKQYARTRRSTKQRIKSLLLFEHIELPHWAEAKSWTPRYHEALRQMPLKQTLRFKLDLLLKDLDYARERILLVHRELRDFCQSEESIKKYLTYLRSLPGFGFVVSSYLLARIGDPANLRNIRELGAFCGLVPTEYSSGESTKKGPITHMGDRTLRSLLIEAAWIAIRKDTELNQFYHRIRTKRKRDGGARIAIVAVARKLTHRVYRVLKEQRPYVIH